MQVILSIWTKKIKDKIILDKNHQCNIEMKIQTEVGSIKIQDKNNLFLDILYLNKI